MNNVLMLAFCRSVPPEFLEELRQVSPVPFKAVKQAPDPRKSLTRPEYASVESVVSLTFESGDHRADFMQMRACREVYERHNRATEEMPVTADTPLVVQA